MKTTLRNLLVVPQFNAANQIVGAVITRYLDREGYRSTVAGTVAEMTPKAQAAFVAVVEAAQKLRTADERISQVFGELLAQIPEKTHTEQRDYIDEETGKMSKQAVTIVDTYRARVSLSLTLCKLDNGGERTMTVDTEQLPVDARTAVLSLWALLALQP
jgi:hypothetical protein